MKKHYLLLAFFSLTTLTLTAQITVSGNVTDDNNQPIGFASVALISSLDSQLVKGALSEESGAFAINEVGPGTYRLGGTFGDGKGQPHQSNSVSHGCPPARFTANVINTGGTDQ